MNDYYDYGTGYSSLFGAMVAIYFALLGFALVFGVLYYILSALAFSRLFKKLGIEGWIAWVPVYNTWKWLELGGQQGWLALLLLVSPAGIVTLVFVLIASYRIGKAFGKGGEWTILAYFLSPLWAFLLSRPEEVYRPETYAQFGWTPPLAGFGSVPAGAAPYYPPAAPPPAA